MSLSAETAYAVLELPIGADVDSVRTSYKRLAMKCHPSEKCNSPSDNKRFCQLSQAYKMLIQHDDGLTSGQPVSMSEAGDIYDSVFHKKTIVCNGCASDSDTSDEDIDDFEEDYTYSYEALNKTKLYNHQGLSSPARSQRVVLTEEERNRNARELISDEERERVDRNKKTQKDGEKQDSKEENAKSEKRRLKKKKQREKKRLEKIEQDEKPDLNNMPEDNAKSKSQSKRNKKYTETEEELDPTAAFVSNAFNKKKKPTSEQTVSNKKDSKTDAKTNGHNEDDVGLDAVVLRSRRLAIRGNEMAQNDHHTQAIELFSEAIRLDPTDFRFFGNRSYCFDRINNFEKALKDAEKAISLSNDWPKGYFRKGRALAGLSKDAEAEQAFLHVLKLDKNCDDALLELHKVRVQQLIEMGFSQQAADLAIKQYGSVRNALDSLLAAQVDTLAASDGSISDDDPPAHRPTVAVSSSTSAHTSQAAESNECIPDTELVKSDTISPHGFRTLWVGNVLPEITEKKLNNMFSKFGTIVSVRCLPDKYCAFINYSSKESASLAMTTMQGAPCLKQRLLIKYPDNPIENGTVLRGGSTPRLALKQSGPVNNGECYFWRTTGCQFGDKCHHAHNPANKGVDKKPWQKNTD